jgi:WD40 repeat protein
MKTSPDGHYAVSADMDGMVKCWDIVTGKLIRSFYHEGVTDLDITPDNHYIISGSMDKNLKVWDLESGQLMKR